MLRATIRFSLNGDKCSAARNQVVAPLKSAGFRNVDTGTWEIFSRQSQTITTAISDALQRIEACGLLDHCWIHIEKLSVRQKASLRGGVKLLDEG